jgi:hypothetical protein
LKEVVPQDRRFAAPQRTGAQQYDRRMDSGSDVLSRRADVVYEGLRGPQPGYGRGGPLVAGVREGGRWRALTPPAPDAELEWGYDRAGLAHLAQAILRDRLGYTPPDAACRAFARDLIAKLPSDFEMPGTEVDEWVDAAEQPGNDLGISV